MIALDEHQPPADDLSQVAIDMRALIDVCQTILIRAAMNDHAGKLEYLAALKAIAPDPT